jgi:mannose-1-phosphate guanylyltransferase/mannose-6-phosphate isomerase
MAPEASAASPRSTTPTASDVYAVILAGGSGTRFWPKSRHLRPKQLCKIGPQPETMLEATLARLDGFIPPERRVIVTHQAQAPATRALVGRRAVVLAEPEAKNTAAALALAALHIESTAKASGTTPTPSPIMVSLHADHLIKNEAVFLDALRLAIETARQSYLTLLAIKPEYAETGYGYLEKGAPLPGLAGAFKVQSFREKPALSVAEEYVASGRFFWNAGLFIWRVDVLLDELAKTLPPTVAKLRAAQAASPKGFAGDDLGALAAAYKELPKISIDNAVLEVSDKVAAVGADIGWQDVGSWDALARAFPPDADGNLLFGDGVLIDSKATTVDTDGPFVAALGVKDLVVVAASGAVLVCPASRSQDVKKIVDWLTAKGRKELL